MPRKAYGMDVEVNGGKGRRMISPHQSGCEATSSHGRLDVSGLGATRGTILTGMSVFGKKSLHLTVLTATSN
jgi:hypothetical protein